MSTSSTPLGFLQGFKESHLTLERSWLKAAVAVTMLTANFLLSGCGGPPSPNPHIQHVAVIDAGSSGSRVVLYERMFQGDALQVEQRFADSGGLALSGFESTPGDAGPLGVKPLLDKLVANLQVSGVSPALVEVHFLATAGMRLVEGRNPAAANAIYDSVRSTLARSGLKLGRIGTLSGIEEGLFAWIDLNEIAGNFKTGREATLGLLEVGGASAQIAFATTAQDNRAVSVSVKGKSHRVFSQSWLGLGQDQARVSMIRLNQAGSGLTNNVCYPDNTGQAGGLQAFDVGIEGLFIDSGRYDFAACSELYDAQLRGMRVREVTTVPGFSASTLVGASSVSFALTDWRATDDVGKLGSHLQANCTGPDAYGNQVLPFLGRTAPGNRFAQNACANGTFMQALVFGAQGLGLLPWQFGVQIDKGQSINWTRGVVLIDP